MLPDCFFSSPACQSAFSRWVAGGWADLADGGDLLRAHRLALAPLRLLRRALRAEVAEELLGLRNLRRQENWTGQRTHLLHSPNVTHSMVNRLLQ